MCRLLQTRHIFVSDDEQHIENDYELCGKAKANGGSPCSSGVITTSLNDVREVRSKIPILKRRPEPTVIYIDKRPKPDSRNIITGVNMHTGRTPSFTLIKEKKGRPTYPPDGSMGLPAYLPDVGSLDTIPQVNNKRKRGQVSIGMDGTGIDEPVPQRAPNDAKMSIGASSKQPAESDHSAAQQHPTTFYPAPIQSRSRSAAGFVDPSSLGGQEEPQSNVDGLWPGMHQRQAMQHANAISVTSVREKGGRPSGRPMTKQTRAILPRYEERYSQNTPRLSDAYTIYTISEDRTGGRMKRAKLYALQRNNGPTFGMATSGPRY